MESIFSFLALDQFVTADLLTIGVLIILESLLSCDNAVALALMVRSLPKDQQGKALRYGIIGAYVFQIIAVCLAAWVMNLWWVKMLGGMYLSWIVIKHFTAKKQEDGTPHGVKPWIIPGLTLFWSTVVMVELTDVAFSVDSIAAAVAFTDKPFVLILAALVYILVMRFAAQGFIKLLHHFPKLETMAFLAVGFIGCKLLLELPGDVLGRVHDLPPAVAYATPAEFRHQAHAVNPPVIAIPHVVTIYSRSISAPDETRFGPAGERASVKAYKEANGWWNLHGRPLIQIEEGASAFMVLGLFGLGFLLGRRKDD